MTEIIVCYNYLNSMFVCYSLSPFFFSSRTKLYGRYLKLTIYLYIKRWQQLQCFHPRPELLHQRQIEDCWESDQRESFFEVVRSPASAFSIHISRSLTPSRTLVSLSFPKTETDLVGGTFRASMKLTQDTL